MNRLALILLSVSLTFAYQPTDAERARWTMSDFRSIATAAHAYQIDHKEFPAAGSIEDLQKLVQPIYIKSLPLHDAWGNSYRYVSDGKTMTIASAGSDGKFDQSTWTTPLKWTPDFNADAVWTDGSFVRCWEYK